VQADLDDALTVAEPGFVVERAVAVPDLREREASARPRVGEIRREERRDGPGQPAEEVARLHQGVRARR
jgi:hypothetical protein